MTDSGGYILVTGANGQLGKAICSALDTEMAPVLAYSSKKLDITNPDAVEKAFSSKKINWLVNCAAYTNVDGAENAFPAAMEANAVAVGHLALICRDLDIPMIHFSSDYVYDNGLTRPLSESDPLNPRSIYAISKLAGEDIIRETWHKHLILRTSWLYSHEGHNFLNTMLRLGSENKHLKIVDDQLGAPTYVADLASAVRSMIRIIEDSGDQSGFWGTYNISNAGETTWYAYARAIFEFASLDVDCEPTDTASFNAAAPRPAYSVLSNQKLNDVFGLKLQNWKAALKKCLQEKGNSGG